MIGGLDAILIAPSNLAIADLILRVCRDRWPECLFQDADSSEVHNLSESWVWESGTLSKEFFVYRDTQAAHCWQAAGAGAETSNSMLHFILRDQPVHTEVTLVCDRLDEIIDSIIESLRSGFLCALSDVGTRRAA